MSQKFLARAGGIVVPVRTFLSPSLITIQNFATVSHTVLALAGPKKYLGEGRSEAISLEMPV